MSPVVRFQPVLFLSIIVWLGCSSQPEAQVIADQPAKTSDTIIDFSFSQNELLGKFNPAEHQSFGLVPLEVASRDGLWLRSEVIESFAEMRKAAIRDGVSLKIISATRTFNHQKRIWEAKWNGTRKVEGSDLSRSIPHPATRARKILEYSSMPGTSRHHWGTDIDINSLNPEYFDTGKGKKEYEWLRDNAYEFGFCQTYTQMDGDRPNGYEEEKWHWTYLPISSLMLNEYLTVIDSSVLGGFSGDSALDFAKVLHYVQGIATECK